MNLSTEHINKTAKKCQERITDIMETEGNVAFRNLSEWASYFKEISSEANSDCLLPLQVEMISKRESSPTPDEMNGIDLKELYGALGNLMMGYPVEELNPASKSFLEECYKELMANVDKDAAKIQKIEKSFHEGFGEEQPSTSTTDELLKNIFSQSDLNPLSLPVSLLEK